MLTNNFDIPRKISFNLKYQENDFTNVNQYDFNQSIKKFEQHDRLMKFKKDMLRPIKKQNAKWRTNLIRCQFVKEDLLKKQKQKIQYKMNRKDEKMNDLFLLNTSLKSVEKNKKSKQSKVSKEKIKENLKIYYDKVEEDRLITESKVINILRKRQLKQIENIESIRDKFEKRNKSSEIKFRLNYQNILKENKIKEKQDQNQKFENFMKWYFFYQEEKKNLKNKNDKQKEIRKRCLELQKELENKYEHQRIQTDLTLKNSAEKRKNQIIQHYNELKQNIELENINIMETLKRKNNIVLKIRNENKENLKKQREKILNSYEKDKSIENNKKNIQ